MFRYMSKLKKEPFFLAHPLPQSLSSCNLAVDLAIKSLPNAVLMSDILATMADLIVFQSGVLLNNL